MKKTLILSVLIGILLLGGLFAASALADENWLAGDPAEVTAVILHTNDVHVAFQDNIGYDGLALYKKELEAQYDHVLLIDAGDAIQGAPIGAISKGMEIIKMMNRVGYDLAVPGNHEFDFGDALAECAQALDCGYTCVNYCTSDGEPIFSPWRILEAGDVKIGFVGVVTPDAFTKSVIKDILNEVGEPMYDFLADSTGDRLAERVQQAIGEVRDAGANYVILVSHLGNNDSITPQYRCDAIVGKLTGLDMVIDGHSHELYNRTATDGAGKLLPVAQANTKLTAIGQLTIYRDGRLEERLIDSVPEPTDVPFERVTRHKVERCVDPDMKAYLDGVVAAYAPLMERKLGTLSRDLIVRDGQVDVSRDAENGLCDLVADAFRVIGGTQTALLNAGSVRNNLEAGMVTYNNILNILPYSSDVVTAKVTGQILLDALEFGVALLPNISGRFPQVSGIAFHINAGIPTSVVQDSTGQYVGVDGPRRVYDVTVGGAPIDPKAEYTMTIPSFLLNGGDGYVMFKEADILSSTMLADNELVMKYIEENLNGVIPEAYEDAQGRICIDGMD